jgi:uncharacterized membrane protein YcjF (UPF0283 family)
MSYPFWNGLVSIFWFMLLVAWIWLIIAIITDVFRDRTMSGWGKALWCLFIIVLPWLGALVYLIARGGSMHERAEAQAQRNDAAFQDYVKRAAVTGGAASMADELAKLADLRDRGAISAEDYDRAKNKVLGPHPEASAPEPRNSVPAAPLA